MKWLVIFLNVAFAGALFLASCDRPAPDLASSSPVASAPSLTAEPNPVPAGEGPGKTKITWRTGSDTSGEVYVATDGGEETLFVRDSEGSADAPWITTGSTYEFRLYEGRDHKKLLAKATVTRARN